ncbi:MAG: triose-phosphate isomerase [Bdellovibrionota bacterium]
MARKKIAAANWKMYKTPQEAEAYFEEWEAPESKAEVVFFPSTILLDTVSMEISGGNVHFGAQNIHFEKEGAFTGETSPETVKSMGAQYALIGHSERRTLFGETNEITAKKVQAAQAAGLTPMLCIGETLAEREAGKTLDVVKKQLNEGLSTLDAKKPFVLAYEPVWAIGTGKVATPLEAEEVHAQIRAHLAEVLSKAISDTTPILYGGSVKPNNADELSQRPNIDGFLVGGASLKPEEFMQITDSLQA